MGFPFRPAAISTHSKFSPNSLFCKSFCTAAAAAVIVDVDVDVFAVVFVVACWLRSDVGPTVVFGLLRLGGELPKARKQDLWQHR